MSKYCINENYFESLSPGAILYIIIHGAFGTDLDSLR